jgi:Kef-type K+ transport system membrane component KefB
VLAAISYDELMLVMVLAVAIPLVLALFPRVPIPASVVEILAGIVVGPAVLGLVKADEVIDVLATLGVAFLLFLAGLELDFDQMRGRPLKLGGAAFGLSVVIGLVLTLPLGVTDVIIDPLYVTVILSATALGIVMPILKDAGQTHTPFGRLVVVSCSIAEFGSIVLLSLLFTGSGDGGFVAGAAKLVLLVLAVLAIAFASSRAGQFPRLDDLMYRLQDTSSQIRIRAAVLLLLGLLALSQELKFDAILGAFMAGALLAAITDPERDEAFGHFRTKLEGIGFGVFIPVFFVATGLRFPVDALFSDESALLRVPLFLVLLLVARGIPAVVFRHDMDRRKTVAAALLQATSLSFIVVATEIGVMIGEVRPINAASLVAAGMLSVLIFPALSLAILRRDARDTEPTTEPAPET